MKKPRVLPVIDDAVLPPDAKVQVHRLQAASEEMLEENNRLWEENGRLKDEVAILKGEKKRPIFKPSRMNEDAGKSSDTEQIDVDAPAKKAKRAGSAKRSKTGQLSALDLIVHPEEAIPPDSRFKGYHDFTVQDIVITTRNTRYRLARWQTPDGRRLCGKLPKQLQGRHFGPSLAAYILYQHHHCHVTQPLLREQLREWGVDISSGQINAILLDGKAPFHDEKDALLAAGLALSAYVTVDDSGARHQGKNGYVTHIGINTLPRSTAACPRAG